MPANPTQSPVARTYGQAGGELAGTAGKHPVDDLMAYWKQYAKEKPEVCAMWCFGIGFVLGWKLKPW